MSTQEKKYWFEDFPVGRVFEGPGPTVTEAQIIEFASKYDPQSFHVDPAAAKESIYGGLISSGWLTASLTMRMIFDAYLKDSAGMGSPGIDNLRWHRPVRPGDTLRMKMTVQESRPSTSKPDRGIVVNLWEVFNQRDELVMAMTGMSMVKRRVPGPAETGSR